MQKISTHLLLAGGELCDVGVVALLHVLVGALQDGLLLQTGHRLLLLHAAEASVRVSHTPTEVHSTLNSSCLLSSCSWLLSALENTMLIDRSFYKNE